MTREQLHRMYHLMEVEFLTPDEEVELNFLRQMYHDIQWEEFIND